VSEEQYLAQMPPKHPKPDAQAPGDVFLQSAPLGNPPLT